MEETIENKIKSREEDLNNAFDEKVKNFEEEKIRNGQKLADSELKLKQLQCVFDESQSELYELKSKEDDKRNAISDEMDLMLTDLDRATQWLLHALPPPCHFSEVLLQVLEGSSEDNPLGKSMHVTDAVKKFKIHFIV